MSDWNTTRDDPWWKACLTSRDLFDAYAQTVPRVGKPTTRLLGGEVFTYDSGLSCVIEAWISPDEVLVAYPPIGPGYGGPHEFEESSIWRLSTDSASTHILLRLGECPFFVERA